MLILAKTLIKYAWDGWYIHPSLVEYVSNKQSIRIVKLGTIIVRTT